MSLLVNNAAYVHGKTFMKLPDHEIEKTFKVNVLSHYWVSINIKEIYISRILLNKIVDLYILFSIFPQITKSFLKNMMENNHGHIVTIASVAGLVGIYNCTDYSASKFATIGYHKSLFIELKVHI